MANEKIFRPDSGRLKALIDRATRLDQWLYQVIASEDTLRRSAQSAAQRLFDDRLKRALEEMDVEHINKGKQGIRVGLLRSAGYETVWQVSRLSFRQICAIDGLGEQSTHKIQDIVRQIISNTKSTLPVRIQSQSPTPADDGLIRALYLMIHTRPLRGQAKELYHANHKPLTQELATVKKGLSSIGWLFKSRRAKEEIALATASLQARLASPFGDGKLSRAWSALNQTDLAQCWSDFRSNAALYYAELEQLGLHWEPQATAGTLPAQLVAEIEAQPLDLRFLKATLRSYQRFGTKYIIHQKRTLLGDEMGLGKTVQAIAAMAALTATGKTHFMVVCPAGVLINWCREIQKFSTLTVTKIHGNDTEALAQWVEHGGVGVTTYESISRFDLPEECRIAMVVSDEAHYVKNPDTQRTRALRKLLQRTEYTLFMTGTPLENRVDEMCFLVSCLQPAVARTLDEVKYLSTAEQFRQQLAPVYLRRTRNDVLQELPDLIEKEQWCALNPVEAQAYREAVLSENFMAIRQVSWQVADLRHSSKANRLVELCCQAQEQGRKVIVFSFFRSTLFKVASLLGERCLEPITGSVSPQRRQEIVDEFSRAEAGAVLVSQVQAGGTGLNIQSASVIIFCEPQIKPSIEQQAISRAYRMGQVRDVLVYRLLAEDTVDEQLMELLRGKQLQFDSFADESTIGEESLKPSESAWIRTLVEAEKRRLLEQEIPMKE